MPVDTGLDGELVVWGTGRLAFERLQQRLARRGADARQRPRAVPQDDLGDWLCGGHKPFFVCSVKVLGEGVDTKTCDSVYWADARGSMPDLVQALLSFSLVVWVQELQRCEHDGVSSKPQDAAADVSVLPLTRPQLAEARRMRAAELFEQRRPSSEVARAVGMHPESVRRWKRLWEQGGAEALRRRPATGRPPKLDDAQVEAVRTALEQGAQAHGFEADLWTLERVGVVVERVTGVTLARASVWRLLTGRLGWTLQRPRRQAVERDESEIARWVAHEWPRIKKGR